MWVSRTGLLLRLEREILFVELLGGFFGFLVVDGVRAGCGGQLEDSLHR